MLSLAAALRPKASRAKTQQGQGSDATGWHGRDMDFGVRLVLIPPSGDLQCELRAAVQHDLRPAIMGIAVYIEGKPILFMPGNKSPSG